MTRALVVKSSAAGTASISSRLVDDLVNNMRRRDPSLQVVLRDVGDNPLPHLTVHTVAGIRAVAATEAEHEATALSETLIQELFDAELLIIGAPMYNFGISSTLKTWFDHILRAGRTFRYTETGPEGLVVGKRAVVILSRGGLYSEGPGAALDHQEPHIKSMLGFMGITDVVVVRAEMLGFGPDAVNRSIAAATAEIETYCDYGQTNR